MAESELTMLGKKLGMTQFFQEDGTAEVVTVVELGPNVVLQKKTTETDGYTSVQLGFDDKKKQRVNKPEAGHAKKSKAPVKRFVREFRLSAKAAEGLEVGHALTVDLLKAGDKVDVSGKSIGKGFQGVMKRHGFAGFPATHGTHEFFRHGGSIGNRTAPGKVFKNKRMAGHMGSRNVTTQNLTVVGIEADKNIVLIRGSVPGSKGSYVELKAAVKGGFESRPLVQQAEESKKPEEGTEKNAES